MARGSTPADFGECLNTLVRVYWFAIGAVCLAEVRWKLLWCFISLRFSLSLK